MHTTATFKALTENCMNLVVFLIPSTPIDWLSYFGVGLVLQPFVKYCNKSRFIELNN